MIVNIQIYVKIMKYHLPRGNWCEVGWYPVITPRSVVTQSTWQLTISNATALSTRAFNPRWGPCSAKTNKPLQPRNRKLSHPSEIVIKLVVSRQVGRPRFHGFPALWRSLTHRDGKAHRELLNHHPGLGVSDTACYTLSETCKRERDRRKKSGLWKFSSEPERM